MSDVLALGPDDRVLLLAPHPDDETLATGGLLQRARACGAAVHVVYATDGENNPWAQRATELRWRISEEDRQRWGARRRQEALRALARLGVPAGAVEILGYPDQGLTSLLLDAAQTPVAKLAALMASYCPTLLVAPTLDDLHPDHSALAVLARLALDRVECRRPRVLDYVVHGLGHRPREREGAPLASTIALRLTSEERRRKRMAILAHRTQLRVHRRGLLAFAADTEWFGATQRASARADSHPLRLAHVEGHTLRLAIAQKARPAAFGQTSLYLAVDRRWGPGKRFRVVLPRRSARVDVCDVASGLVVAQGTFTSGASDGILRMPAALLRGAAAAFLKLERRFGFFDEAGWREIPLAAPVPRQPVMSWPQIAATREPVPRPAGVSEGLRA